MRFMMTHVYDIDSKTIVAAKGGAERVIAVCKLDEPDLKKIFRHINELANNGYRLLGVASAVYKGFSFPESQNDFDWHFEGLVALYDPPRKDIPAVLRAIQDAKINVKIVTGDYPETTVNIAQRVGIINPSYYYTGEAVMAMSDDQLRKAGQETNVFARMFPDVKLRLINALQADGKIVAMSRDKNIISSTASKINDGITALYFCELGRQAATQSEIGIGIITFDVLVIVGHNIVNITTTIGPSTTRCLVGLLIL